MAAVAAAAAAAVAAVAAVAAAAAVAAVAAVVVHALCFAYVAVSLGFVLPNFPVELLDFDGFAAVVVDGLAVELHYCYYDDVVAAVVPHAVVHPQHRFLPVPQTSFPTLLPKTYQGTIQKIFSFAWLTPS